MHKIISKWDMSKDEIVIEKLHYPYHIKYLSILWIVFLLNSFSQNQLFAQINSSSIDSIRFKIDSLFREKNNQQCIQILDSIKTQFEQKFKFYDYKIKYLLEEKKDSINKYNDSLKILYKLRSEYGASNLIMHVILGYDSSSFSDFKSKFERIEKKIKRHEGSRILLGSGIDSLLNEKAILLFEFRDRFGNLKASLEFWSLVITRAVSFQSNIISEVYLFCDTNYTPQENLSIDEIRREFKFVGYTPLDIDLPRYKYSAFCISDDKVSRLNTFTVGEKNIVINFRIDN